ncbi:PAC2 family protein [Leifsonia sp. ALI-44-B]|jgi:hypothetical protein|uniref:proteasome assembly chaperone family protein n=1 Tax=Leifsonia sp. ALI-44-B TaxID=1933776 RepID=UPI00097C14CB|nr:PAC2 family protein [Leifsonia sp. ALI-44-B]ONI63686.1 PAC2 family protein [Leifsonia sp. ALI-44-B]
MNETDRLYQTTDAFGRVPSGLDLVVSLTGFSDAGSAASQFNEYALGALTSEPVAVFDNDVLLDYRARRPIIYFNQDHVSDYSPAKLQLSLAYDDLQQPFLLLTGYEPDFRWEGFIAQVLDLMDQFEVASTTWVHAIPMPVPHTRPIGVTVSGNRSDLIESMSVWRPHTQVPANVLHLLEFRLAARGADVSGFALLIPHYLADTEYPSAALAAIDSISAATGLILPTDSLREDGREFVSRIDEQVAGNEELQRLVGTLEERYDTYMEGSALKSPLVDSEGGLPSADEIAAELEKFLAGRRGGDERRPEDWR